MMIENIHEMFETLKDLDSKAVNTKEHLYYACVTAIMEYRLEYERTDQQTAALFAELHAIYNPEV